MKKLILSLVFVLLAFGLNAQSNVIKTNPLGLAFLFCAKDTQNQDELINSIIFC